MEGALSQDFFDMEVILVENGSTDDTARKAEALAEQYEKVRCIHVEKNAKLGLARQAGLSEARGRYLCFVDADDEFTGNGVLSLLHKRLVAEKGDIAAGNYVRRFGEEIVPAARHGFTEETETDTEQFRLDAFFTGGNLSYLWAKLYRADFIRENGISFLDLCYGEDKHFNLSCYVKKPRYVFLDEDLYCYTMNPDSVSHRYHSDYGKNWRRAATGLFLSCNKEERRKYYSLAAYILLFAAFFEGKQEMEYTRSVKRLRRAEKRYCEDPFLRKLLLWMTREKVYEELTPGFWKTALKVQTFLVLHRSEPLMTLGTLGILLFQIDRKLSSTGR